MNTYIPYLVLTGYLSFITYTVYIQLETQILLKILQNKFFSINKKEEYTNGEILQKYSDL